MLVGLQDCQAENLYEVQLEEMKITCYCPPQFPVGSKTASGEPTRYGICASSKERLNGCYLIWIYDENEPNHQGKFLGYFECKDTGGTDAIKNNYVLDVYTERYNDAKYLMTITKGKIVCQYVPNVKG